jgi:hypothetical protein
MRTTLNENKKLANFIANNYPKKKNDNLKNVIVEKIQSFERIFK